MGEKINKPELLELIKHEVNASIEEKKKRYSKKDITIILDAFVDITKLSVRNGSKVYIAEFGTFGSTPYGKRDGRDPNTNETIKLPPVKIPKFKPSKSFKDLINEE